MIRILLLAALLVPFAARAEQRKPLHAVEIPKQYRGAWCETRWQTIYERCSSADFKIKRTYWTTVESNCKVLSVRKSRYGGHRLLATCEGDEGSRDMPTRVEVRWWLGTNNTRLQTIQKVEHE